MYDWDETPELNITPLVDVMLVLLAILMVIAPTIVYEELIKLPTGSEKKALTKKPPVNIVINKNKEIMLNGEKFAFKGFEDKFSKKKSSSFFVMLKCFLETYSSGIITSQSTDLPIIL